MHDIPKIKVLFVDDQLLFVHSLSRVISSRAEDIEVVGITENGLEAVAAVKNNNPDVVIMDIKMPVMNGVEATKIISRENPETKIMMLTTFDEDEYVFEALKYGAKGYLLKNLLPEDVITAIRALYAGIDQISPTIISRLTKKMKQEEFSTVPRTVSKNPSLPLWFIDLTRLEKSIVELVVQGMSNKEVASCLNLAEQTVKNYLSTIYGKMNVHKRSQVIKKYAEVEATNFRN
jgi:DNA-binding NarL/FixJ family response regulator